ncbi:PIG-L family deacetylase [Aliiroseovarius sp. YM-037]|uniref:PIG-L family deacetylase n=1 Tax=Aliiroseovarius sp. YM-037 TaxID=3341728 RepID=UPI003A7FAF81
MPLSDQARIAAERDSPRVVALWQALTALRSVVSFMNTGAHPDDETSAMLAALRFRDGVDISYACSTRGEGGQNDIGTEAVAALGTLRTAEMEAACDRLDLRMYWLSEHPDDTIFDFGFSKSGEETLAKWGRDRTLARFVDVIRTERPDIICPTFLDVPGQHGHHRAMTEAAHLVMDLAADPDFKGSDLPPWEVKKLYLPAWSGAGQAYDDDLPPPPTTLTIAAKGRDPVTGWSFARIGQQSRAMHRTQGMGRWVPAGAEIDFPLHLARSRLTGEDTDIMSGLPQTLRDLDAPAIAADLAAAQDACDAALAAFPATADVLRHACAALTALRRATPGCPAGIAHKLARKDTQLCRVIHLSIGVDMHARLSSDILHPGDEAMWTTEHSASVTLTPRLPDGWTANGNRLRLSDGAAISDPYPSAYRPGEPDAPCLDVSISAHGITATTAVPFEVPPVVLPMRAATLTPTANVINLATTNRVISISATEAGGGTPDLRAPDGWKVGGADGRFTVTIPGNATPGLHTLTLTLDGQNAHSVRHIRHPHTAPRALVTPAEVRVLLIDAALPQARVGYIGGGNDRVGWWLDRMGADVTDLSDTPLTDAILAGFDTLVIGIFAMKFCPGLAAAMPRIHAWMRNGGTLVMLYHRPWDNWDADKTPPHRLEIGQPSLRWRVTDEAAEVTILAPDHPLLHQPNRIGAEDWASWHKERGLYFAKEWDAAYTPLISMHDAGEEPLNGAWLVADVGKGRHVHTSLILHHQMERLTPGAFRIMANLLAKRG